MKPLAEKPLVYQKPWLYFLCYIAWACVLWKLSSDRLPEVGGPQIPHLDKVLHAGYFFGGAGLLSAFLFLRSKGNVQWHVILWIVIFCGALVGRLDEWHQSWVVGRSGNDINDFAADITGTLLGFLVFKKVYKKFFL